MKIIKIILPTFFIVKMTLSFPNVSIHKYELIPVDTISDSLVVIKGILRMASRDNKEYCHYYKYHYDDTVSLNQLSDTLIYRAQKSKYVFLAHIDTVIKITKSVRVKEPAGWFYAIADNAESLVVVIDDSFKGNGIKDTFSVIRDGCIDCDPFRPQSYLTLIKKPFIVFANSMKRSADLGITPIIIHVNATSDTVVLEPAKGYFVNSNIIVSPMHIGYISLADFKKHVISGLNK